MNVTLTKAYVGVDVSKNNLDVYIHPQAIKFRIPNTIQGMKKLFSELAKHSIEQVVCEASGGYEFLMCDQLNAVGYNTWCVEPKRIKAFIYSEGQRAKTDAIDAKMIAFFAARMKRNYEPLKLNPLHHKLNALVKCKNDLTATLATQKTRLKSPISDEFSNKIFKKIVAFIENKIAAIENEIAKLLKQDEQLSRKVKLLTSMKGVGTSTAVSLIIFVPELGLVNKKEIAAILGIAPYPRQSGTYTGKSAISGGRAEPRHALYMAALSAAYTSPKFKQFYQKLRDSGKQAKIALVAVMRKMIVILNTMVMKNEEWNPSMA